jgi:hypothetical protein
MRNVPWILMLLCSVLHGDVDRRPKPWKIDFTLSLAEKEGKWIFTVDGATDLPKETVLRARVYAVSLVDHPFEGQVEDEEELVHGDDPVQPSWREVHGEGREVPGGGLRVQAQALLAAYRARVFYVPDLQTPSITLKAGDEEFSRKADLRVGTDEEYEKELKARQELSLKDLQYLEGSTTRARRLDRDLRCGSARAGRRGRRRRSPPWRRSRSGTRRDSRCGPSRPSGWGG